MSAPIWKTPIADVPGIQSLLIGPILAVGNQQEELMVWHRSEPRKHRAIAIVMTGQASPDEEEAKFLGTVLFLGGAYVIHVFERLNV